VRDLCGRRCVCAARSASAARAPSRAPDLPPPAPSFLLLILPFVLPRSPLLIALSRPLSLPLARAQSAAIEETLSRLAVMGGVECYVITDGKGAILRQSKGISAADAAKYASEVLRLTQKARHVVRDLDPKNDLEIMRLRAKDREILAAPGDDFLVIIVQKWRAASDEK
jgi:dynein light chain roadblock-type